MAQYRHRRLRGLALPATGDHGAGDRGLDSEGGAAMTADNKTPFRVVAGTDGPTEGPESNAAKIAGVQARCRNYDGKPRNVRSDAGIPKKAAKADGEIEMKRAQAYADMEPHLCAVV